MKILHGTWIPTQDDEFICSGAFYLWVETTERQKGRKVTGQSHPHHLRSAQLETFLVDELGIKPESERGLGTALAPKHFLLPSTDGAPLPSLELARYLETELPNDFEFQFWQVDCYRVTTSVKTSSYTYATVNNIIKLLNELHFLALHQLNDVQLGSDLFFWYHYTQFVKQVILKDQYIPALKYRETKHTKGRKKAKQSAFEIYPGWEIVSEAYEAQLHEYPEAMPLACVSGFSAPQDQKEFYERETLLRHFSECLLSDIITHTPTTATFERQYAGTLLEKCLDTERLRLPGTTDAALEDYQQWQVWRGRINQTQAALPFNLYFQLQAPDKPEEAWFLQFLVAPKSDPSLRLSLLDYWRLSPKQQTGLHKQFGQDFEANLLLNLGYAARIYPVFWQGLETDEPVGVYLDLDQAYEFLKETAWVLEDAGYKIIVPAWWTPTGRQRTKLRLRASGSQSSGVTTSQGYMSLNNLIQYRYELAIGEQPVSEREWQQLVAAKAPLVKFRGQWVELDPAKMQQMLEFWQTHSQEDAQMTLLEMLQREAEAGEDIEVERDNTLEELLTKLSDHSQLAPVEELPQFQGTLREYQKRGVAWLNYLESLGLSGCLADDMGLGKSVQVIARLVQERANGQTVLPTLLIAPTSVLGNWQREIMKFAPHLRSLVHYGSDRLQEPEAFTNACLKQDIVITSYTLARKDAKLLNSLEWHRLVLDEAQNIKNPKTAQTKAILKLSARHRLTLTGTPIENRLLDLWSIFNFLNPGYLGKQAQFRKTFELPIQKESDRTQATVLKKLVEPLILRRVKTDRAIIQDLPDKVEQKVYCNLTTEQASLYEAVVKDVERQLGEAEGIGRKGLILSTLMKLKQVCNHPRQFLQDESEFAPERSHKLSRLQEMLEEVLAEQESLLVFTQFREIGNALEQHLRHNYHYSTYYIHGGTPRTKRERFIAEFQDPGTPASVFILSLKAGGVGITLTKANHVFHFDRWWNPAVEDQATDRAFRIGQAKNVFVHKFVTLGTLEERIDQMIEDKKQLSASIVGSDESWLTELNNEAFRELINLNRSAVLD